MALTALLDEPQVNEDQQAIRSRFCEVTGYGRSDILSLNYATGMFLTFNGGKYQLVGDEVKYISGPPVDMEDRMEI